MKAKVIIFAILMVYRIALSAQEIISWDNPVSGYCNPTGTIAITKVDLCPDSTVVHIHVDYPHGYWIKMGSGIYLHTKEGDYKIRNASVVGLDKEFFMPESNMVDFTMTFDALPASVKSFDFIESGGWIIRNVRNRDYRPEGITDTYWRDDATGDWLIGFGKNVAVYKSRFWTVADLKERKGAYTLTLVDGSESLPVKVGKMKNNTRRITVGDCKPVECSYIAGEALPYYPQFDPEKGFKDNGYSDGDSVTIVGWWKDMPQEAWGYSKEFGVLTANLITDEQDRYSCPMDSLGRFVLKMPLLNTAEVFVDWQRSLIRTVLEPGETYFMLYDFLTGQKLIMGENSRFQNELLASGPMTHRQLLGPRDKMTDAEAMALLAEADRVRTSELAELDRQIEEHPTLSQRYRDFIKGECNENMGRDLMQLRFLINKYNLPKEYLDFVDKEAWRKVDKPYTLHGEFCTFMRDFLDQPKARNFDFADMLVNAVKGEINAIRSLAAEGKISLTDSDRIVLSKMVEGTKVLRDSLNLLSDFNNIEAIQGMMDKVFNDTALADRYNKMKEQNLALLQKEIGIADFKETAAILDSLTSDRNLRDIYLAHEFYEELEHSNQPLGELELAYFEREVQLPAARRVVAEKHDMYVALKNRDISTDKSLTAAKDVSEMSDGEQIMREIVAPYKGKIILVDVWGTWCGPCREALSHFAEHQERLKPYDMVFIYLANNSPKEGWENVIKRYNVLGDNVVHYNLPAEQQAAVENFLKVNGYPTYRLIDKNGNLLDVNADVRHLESLENVLKQL